MSGSISKILIVGAGWTGRQIATQCAAHQIHVSLADSAPHVLESAMAWIPAHFEKIATEAKWPAKAFDSFSKYLHRFEWMTTIDSKNNSATREREPKVLHSEFDLVLECVSEQASIKRRVLKQISDRFSNDTIICSNSSYFTPSNLLKYVTYPERYAHFHFHAPIHLATIVDVACSPVTSNDVAERICDLARRIGQHPIRQDKENPGYIYNWLLQSLIKSALELADRKIAPPEEIEFAWKKITGMPVGPFGIMDTIGLDLVQQVLSNARWVGDQDAIQRLVDVLTPLVNAGELGVKTGKGFFDYASNGGPTPLRSDQQSPLPPLDDSNNNSHAKTIAKS